MMMFKNRNRLILCVLLVVFVMVSLNSVQAKSNQKQDIAKAKMANTNTKETDTEDYPIIHFYDVVRTNTYYLTQIGRCEEYVVNCFDYTLIMYHRKTGELTQVKGESLHSLCADKVTPCQYLGTIFKKGEMKYFLNDGASAFKILKNNKVILEEKAKKIPLPQESL